MVTAGRRWLVIINPRSGTERKSGQESEILSHLERWGIAAKIIYTSKPGEATELASGLADQYEAVIAAGGDGTVREVAEGLIGKSTPLGILPLGSGNGLARHLGMSPKLTYALSQLVHAESIRLDAFISNGRLGVNIAGMGYDGEIARLFTSRKRRGLVGYLQVILKSFFSFTEFKVISSGDSFPVFMVCAANGSQFGNDAVIARSANVSDGLLEVRLVKKPKLWQIPRLFWNLYNGKSHDLVSEFRTQAITLMTDAPQPIHVDGDFMGFAARLEIRTMPSAINVLAVQTK